MSKKEHKDIIFVGQSSELMELFGRLKRPQNVLGFFCLADGVESQTYNVLGEPSEVPAFIKKNAQIKRVYCSVAEFSVEQVRQIQEACKVRAVKFCAVLPVLNSLDARFVPMKVGGQLLLTPSAEPLSKMRNLLVKRIFDIVVSLLLLLTIFPVMYLIKYIIAKKAKIGTVVRVQPCVGPNGRQFLKLSFRPIGDSVSKLEKYPQLLNVLAGKMSLVGPTPVPLSSEDESLPIRLDRRYCKSGMFSWSKDRNGENINALSDDIWYVEHWSIWLDLRVLFMH